MVALSFFSIQNGALGLSHFPLFFSTKWSEGRLQIIAKSSLSFMLSLVLLVLKHVFHTASPIFFSLCITSILCGSNNLEKYGNCLKQRTCVQLCNLPKVSASPTNLFKFAWTSSPVKRLGCSSNTFVFLRNALACFLNA